jgi:hypothetical protein
LIALEWAPHDEAIAGPTRSCNDPEREGILITHAYLHNDDRRHDHANTDSHQRFNPHDYATPGGVNDGEELWQELVRRHRFY